MPKGTVDQMAEWLRIARDMRRQDFGELLRRKRKARGIKAPQMADRIGVHVSRIYIWERGESTPNTIGRKLRIN
jgi:ribosome-binding protein aMBF1 (putative translation factor)